MSFFRLDRAADRAMRSAVLAAEAAGWAGCPTEAVTVSRTTDGVPLVQAGGRILPASLSWRGTALLTGIAPAPVGVDLEPVGRTREPPWAVLAPPERAALRAVEDPDERHERFLRLWTVKEAVLKALGVGLTREPATVAVAPDDPTAPAIRLYGRSLPVRVSAAGAFVDGSDRFIWACVVL